MVETSTAIEIFCSYAHEDEVWLRKLETHLSLLKRQGLISLWHDRLIVPGTDWAHTIDGLFGPYTKNTTLRSIPPGLKRLGTNLAMLVKEVELLRTNPEPIWFRHC